MNEYSIKALKRRALRRSRTLIATSTTDTENRGPKLIGRSRLAIFLTKLRAPFSRAFWEDLMEHTDNETLVDWKLLSYAYLEAGVIESIGSWVWPFSHRVHAWNRGFILIDYFHISWCSGNRDLRLENFALRKKRIVCHTVLMVRLIVLFLFCSVYFTRSSPDFINGRGQIITATQQVEALAQAQSITYLSIFIIQCFNVRLFLLDYTPSYAYHQLFAVKAKLSFPFGRQVVSNVWNFVGIMAGACLGIFIIYTPPLHYVFGGSYHLLPLYWLIPMAFGVLLLIWSSLRVLLMRKSLNKAKVRDIKGLMMCKSTAHSILKVVLTYVTVPTMRTMSIRSRR